MTKSHRATSSHFWTTRNSWPRHASARSLVEERTLALDDLKAVIAEEAEIVRANNARRQEQLDELETAAREMLEVAQANFRNSSQLFDERIVTRTHLEQTQQEFNEARRVLLELGRDRGVLEAEAIRYENDMAVRVREMSEKVEAAKRQLSEIEALMAGEKVLAPASGQLIEIQVTAGAVVNRGQAVASIRTGSTELEVLLYVPPDEGKKVEVGMQALVSPVTVKREEFGAIRATVLSLSPFRRAWKAWWRCSRMRAWPGDSRRTGRLMPDGSPWFATR